MSPPSNRRVRRASIPDVLESPPGPEARPEETAAPAPRKPPSAFALALKDAGGVALVIATAVGVAYGAERYITSSPRFAVADVIVTGNHFRTEEQVLTTAGIGVGENVFSIDLDRAQASLEGDPWIAEATLARRLPDAIIVSVREREAAAVVSIGGDTYLSTRKGELFKRLEAGDPVDLPIVTGLEADRVGRDRDGTEKAIVRALDLASDYEHGSLGQRLPLEEIHLSPEGGITLVVGRGGTQLVLGGPPYRRKLEEASRVVGEIERRGSKADAVFLDNEARPDRVVARVK